MKQISKAEVIQKAMVEIRKGQEQYKYFFDNLMTSSWVMPLYEQGMFKDPFDVERKDGYIRFPFWPESAYLARIAQDEPDLVTNIILGIKETDNERVHEDYVTAALNMPKEFSIKIAKMEIEWLKKTPRLYTILPEKISELIVKLANNGVPNVAIPLAENILRLDINPSSTSFKIQEVQSKLDEWEYERILKNCIPALTKSGQLKVIEMLFWLLEPVLKERNYGGEIDELTGDRCDQSSAWKPTVMDSEQNFDSFEGMLVSAIRDAGYLLVESGLNTMTEIIDFYENRGWSVFRRLSLDILRKFPEKDNDLLVDWITNKTHFDNWNVLCEYNLLLRDCFRLLTLDHQNLILGWINDGLDRTTLFNDLKACLARDPNSEEMERENEIWQLNRLAPIRDSLSGEWKEKYDILAGKYGVPKHPEFPMYIETFTGPTSPINAGDIEAISVNDLIDYIKKWHPEGNWNSPSPEGLGRVLESVVSTNPEKFAEQAMEFSGLDATYVRCLIRGLSSSLKDNKTFSWEQVLLLCEWIIHQPLEPFGVSKHDERDPDWSWSKKAVAHLISDGVSSGNTGLLIDDRDKVWNILFHLINDPDPTIEREREDLKQLDPYTLSINSIRGVAMSGVIKYGLWVRHEIDSHGVTPLPKELDCIPEVWETLNEHLDISKDPSLAVRSVYGKLLPWIVLMDSQWVLKSLNLLFTENTYDEYFFASWSTYIVYNKPYDAVFDVVHEVYFQAIKFLGQELPVGVHKNYEKRLIEHLAILFLRNKLEDYQIPGSLMDIFYKEASVELASHFITTIGRVLNNGNEISPEIIKKAQGLVESRINVVKQDGQSPDRNLELINFGWLFSAEQLDAKWALPTIIEIMDITRNIEPKYRVIQRLENTISIMPGETLEVLEIIMNNEKTNRSIYGWEKQVENILSFALDYQDVEIQEKAKGIVNLLGALGYRNFRKLLQ